MPFENYYKQINTIPTDCNKSPYNIYRLQALRSSSPVKDTALSRPELGFKSRSEHSGFAGTGPGSNRYNSRFLQAKKC